MKADLGSRIGAGVLALGFAAVLAVAAFLDPDSRGHGTHESMGLPACGWVAAFDKPCPTCGMTTSFAYAAEGRYVTAFRTQPMGAALAVLSATLVWVFASIAVGGARLWDEVGLMFRTKVVWAGLILLGLAWVYKVLTWDSVL